MALEQSSAIASVVALPRFGAAVIALPPRVKHLRAEPGRLGWMRAAIALAFRHRFDAVFCGHLNAAPLAAALARLRGKPLWLQAHGIEAWQRPEIAVQRAVREARLVTAVSRYTRARLLAWSDIDPARVRVLPNTVAARFVRRARPEHLVARHGLEGRRVVLTVGRLVADERYKGHDRIIRAMPQVLRSVPEALYLVVGGGDDLPRLANIAREAGVVDKVAFAGSVAEDELPLYFNVADVFAMPSTGEGFGIVFLEAARCGLPVIGGNKDGSVDALADGAVGTVLDPDDSHALESALVAALQAGLLAQPNAAVERFAVPHFAKHVDDLVREYLA